jgi:hypothetical protein
MLRGSYDHVAQWNTIYSRLCIASSKNAIVDEHVFTDVAVVFLKLSNLMNREAIAFGRLDA